MHLLIYKALYLSLTKVERIDARALQYSSTLYFEFQVLTSDFHLARFRQLHRCAPLVLKQTHLSSLLCVIRAFQLDLVVLLISAVFSVGCPSMPDACNACNSNPVIMGNAALNWLNSSLVLQGGSRAPGLRTMCL